jgi:regulator of sirC expression with transglutaminase-like and TPR domain
VDHAIFMSQPHVTRARFAALVSQPDIDLAEAALLIAAEEYPGLDIRACLGKLDRLASEVRPRLRDIQSELGRVDALVDFLHHEQGFRGNVEAYYDPRNSFLNDVLERRVGIPISLAVIYIEVGRRVDVPLSGVSFPGHFLLRVGEDDPHFLDPFNPQDVMTEADCKELLAQMAQGRISYDPRLLDAAVPRQILVRMLRNLKLLYLRAESFDKAVAAIDRILLLEPDETQEYRDRGIAHLRLETYRQALADLDHYVGLTPDCDASIRSTLDYLREQVAMLN